MRRFLNVSRPCYDKFSRCPGWAGGGIRYPRVDQCDNGRIMVDYEDPHWRWRWQRCDKCNVLVLPYMTRWLDPGWWKWRLRAMPGRVADRWQDVRRRWS